MLSRQPGRGSELGEEKQTEGRAPKHAPDAEATRALGDQYRGRGQQDADRDALCEGLSAGTRRIFAKRDTTRVSISGVPDPSRDSAGAKSTLAKQPRRTVLTHVRAEDSWPAAALATSAPGVSKSDLLGCLERPRPDLPGSESGQPACGSSQPGCGSNQPAPGTGRRPPRPTPSRSPARACSACTSPRRARATGQSAPGLTASTSGDTVTASANTGAGPTPSSSPAGAPRRSPSEQGDRR